MSKRKNRRSRLQYPALSRGYNLGSREEALDIDYADKLSPKEKEWLNSFLEEEVNANLNHPGKKLNNVNSKKNRSRIYGNNNARNRDILTKLKARKENYELQESDSYEIEDSIIAKIDRDKLKKPEDS